MDRFVDVKDGYYIHIEDSFDKLKTEYKKMMIITDSNVCNYHLHNLKKQLEKSCDSVHHAVFEAGESSKNLATIEKLYTACIDAELDRKSCIVALGGGVVGDMAGFVSATYMRGIDYIQVPTSLLAMADSSVGGKTGVDFGGGKNLIGAFWQPKQVYINTKVLDTLPEREFYAGMAEIIKHGFIRDKSLHDFLVGNKEDIVSRKYEAVAQMLARNSMIKADVVGQDERENGLRAILNYGHTIGHAIESAEGFRLLHGECVALGMVAAADISLGRGLISSAEFDEMKNLIEFFRLPVKTETETEKINSFAQKDKKRENGVQKFVLLEGIGSCRIVKDVTADEWNKAIEIVVG